MNLVLVQGVCAWVTCEMVYGHRLWCDYIATSTIHVTVSKYSPLRCRRSFASLSHVHVVYPGTVEGPWGRRGAVVGGLYDQMQHPLKRQVKGIRNKA